MMTRKKQADTRVGNSVTPERKEKVKNSQADRRKRLTQAATIAGYNTIDKLAAAIISGEAVVTKINQP